MYGVAPPLGVNGEKLVIAVPTVKLCAVVLAVALIEEVVPLPTPPKQALSNRTSNGIALRNILLILNFNLSSFSIGEFG